MSSVRVKNRLRQWATTEKSVKLEGNALDMALDIERQSAMLNPIKDGDLRDSHLTERRGPLRYRISANTPYARRQHFEHKSKSKYLERAGQNVTRNPEKYFR